MNVHTVTFKLKFEHSLMNIKGNICLLNGNWDIKTIAACFAISAIEKISGTGGNCNTSDIMKRVQCHLK